MRSVLVFSHYLFFFRYEKLLAHISRALGLTTIFGDKLSHALITMVGVRPTCGSDMIATTRHGSAMTIKLKALGFDMVARSKSVRSWVWHDRHTKSYWA